MTDDVDARDHRDGVLARRRVPCICPRQSEPDPPVGVSVDLRLSRGIEVEAVRCSSCDRRWTRVNVP